MPQTSVSTLDSFIQTSRPPQPPIAISQEIRDRGSIFVANIYPATSPALARTQIYHLKHVIHGSKPASHEVAAWRCMVLKHGRSGLEGADDFELMVGSDDDGEQWAGARVLKVMQAHAIIDAVVIVSRWCAAVFVSCSSCVNNFQVWWHPTRAFPFRSH